MKTVRSYMSVPFFLIGLIVMLMILSSCSSTIQKERDEKLFTNDWKFMLGDSADAYKTDFPDSNWRVLNLPHDWSIEGKFSEDNPAKVGGGALPGGVGWYRKTFTMDETMKDHQAFIEFDGVYRNSEVWINEHYLGKRPFGYISFRYDLTPYLNYGNENNVIAVRVDNSKQPNSRWYSGSGIYRDVRLVTTQKVYVDHWGTFITSRMLDDKTAELQIETKIMNASDSSADVELITSIVDTCGREVGSAATETSIDPGAQATISQTIKLEEPRIWSIENPNLYKAVTNVKNKGKLSDDYVTQFGIRTIKFDVEKGFLLNGKQVKIKGMCMHHDLGCLGSAVNKRAIERQLEILKAMGANAIRTTHNPPAREVLDLCDEMGFVVMDEAFDMWAASKNDYDYHLDFDEWHERDLTDFIMRDRNHPSIVIWSIGNELAEQWDVKDTTALRIAPELRRIVRAVDTTRPITAACNVLEPRNSVFESGALDVIGFNYNDKFYEKVPEMYPGKPFIATETESSIHTRGVYDMPSDSVRVWPKRWDVPLEDGNPDFTCSSYDNCRVPWGVTHEGMWAYMKKYDYITGMFTWTGFDYLGEPTPYGWPARSSYFGLVDLAGFPKDPYYFYQSVWTDEPMLHVFPHWNWKEGETVDVWAYTNCESVELFLNGESLGIKQNTDDTYHLVWRLQYTPGTLKAVARNEGKEILVQEINTAGDPYKIKLEADRDAISADGLELSFVTVKVLDKDGNLVPHADNLIQFEIEGQGKIAGVDNGLQTSHEPFKADYRKAFSGLCLAVIQSTEVPGEIILKAASDNLEGDRIVIKTK